MEVIILAGGFGTRLQSVVKDIPKPMADINGYPFLKYVFDYLSKYNITKVILSVGYKQEIIKEYFETSYKNINIVYSTENNPLGTGGAIKKALNYCTNSNTIVLNGDTFCNIQLDEFVNNSIKDSDMSMVIKKMKKFDRYGSVEIKDNKVINFKEKMYYKEAFINAGIYLIKNKIFDSYTLPTNFSFEEFLEKNIRNLNIYSYKEEDNYFIDIGIPADYEKAKNDFKDIF
ncbi:D-glycero-D-manno-heptose 1-phosphate guanosyltransferase [Malaciobacter mytili LMG 24559]|uniref:D-glycero-D-manno-heptose 1-phosphate guanosyltransferase n=1 Tax=Malaciobacter mytili LMG 24559 TaxID=1032238 RepID=A0AAX2AIR7_9BACT|nr:nucleotidyltransferase family protein [Malaciobacter mytili]AXH14298.1 sugar-phosphate nucleotidyltransferase [Malaciobacter mytili LMG 24559]RXK16520.1 D-glycero-D-manno-heptose 1-phosphate guanosyltransferase [Malaciobacter mytili LMG 24559]